MLTDAEGTKDGGIGAIRLGTDQPQLIANVGLQGTGTIRRRAPHVLAERRGTWRTAFH